MKNSRIAFVVAALAPAIAGAQSATATATAQTAAKAEIPSSYSAESQARLNATFERARERKLPERPIRDRIAEGQAKAASEAQVVIAAERAGARLEAAQAVLVRAGRQPSESELIRAEAALARGATEAQVESAVKSAPADQKLEVALDAIVAAPATGAEASVKATIKPPVAGATADVTGAAAATTGAATGVTGAATAGVGAVIKKPPMI